jgi:hypothetical protein
LIKHSRKLFFALKFFFFFCRHQGFETQFISSVPLYEAKAYAQCFCGSEQITPHLHFLNSYRYDFRNFFNFKIEKKKRKNFFSMKKQQ